MRLLLADNHDLVREAVELLLHQWDSTIEVIHARSLSDAIGKAAENPALDLMLLDWNMPGMNQLAGLQEMRRRNPEVPVGLIVDHGNPEIVGAALNVGAIGIIPKAISGKALVAAIQLMSSGARYIPEPRFMDPAYVDGVISREGGLAESNIDKLTEREHQVLAVLMGGVSNKEIARYFEIEVVTVAVHLSRIYRKLGVVNRTQATRKAMELGLTPVEVRPNGNNRPS